MNSSIPIGFYTAGICCCLFGAAFIAGLINPTTCGSGNCYESEKWAVSGTIGLIGILFLAIGVNLDAIEKESVDRLNQLKKN